MVEEALLDESDVIADISDMDVVIDELDIESAAEVSDIGPVLGEAEGEAAADVSPGEAMADVSSKKAMADGSDISNDVMEEKKWWLKMGGAWVERGKVHGDTRECFSLWSEMVGGTDAGCWFVESGWRREEGGE